MKNTPVAFTKEIPEDLACYFTDFFNKNINNFDKSWIEEETIALALYDLTEPTCMWERWDPSRAVPEFNDKIEELVDVLDITYSNLSSFIKREYLPVGVHVDSEFDPEKDKHAYFSYDGGGFPNDGPGYSIILPVNTYGEHHDTIVFKPTAAGNAEMLEKIMGYFDDEKIPEDWQLHNNEYGLDYNDYNHVHMGIFHNEKCILDYLEIEQVLQWRQNTAIAFNKTNLHTSINFRRHGITHKDFVLVHTNSYPYS